MITQDDIDAMGGDVDIVDRLIQPKKVFPQDIDKPYYALYYEAAEEIVRLRATVQRNTDKL